MAKAKKTKTKSTARSKTETPPPALERDVRDDSAALYQAGGYRQQ